MNFTLPCALQGLARSGFFLYWWHFHLETLLHACKSTHKELHVSPEMVAALIIRSEEILLGLRSAARAFYSTVWDMFGRHVEPGE